MLSVRGTYWYIVDVVTVVKTHCHSSYHSLFIPAPKCIALVMSAPDFALISSSSPSRLPFTTAWVDSVRKLRQTTPELYSLTRERLVELLRLPQPNEELLAHLLCLHPRRGRSTTHAYRLTGCAQCGIMLCPATWLITTSMTPTASHWHTASTRAGSHYAAGRCLVPLRLSLCSPWLSLPTLAE